jgi:hypothetical protein
MAIWNFSATTLNMIGTPTWGLFIDRDDTLHVRIAGTTQIQRWASLSFSSSTTMNTPWPNGTSLFAAYNGDMYVDGWNGSKHQIVRQSVHATNWNTVMITDGPCHGLVVSIYNDIYCPISHLHIVQRCRSIDRINETTILAGTRITLVAYMSLVISTCMSPIVATTVSSSFASIKHRPPPPSTHRVVLSSTARQV